MIFYWITRRQLHILITEQETGGGGSQFQLIFFGQNKFKQMTDTLRFNTDPNATDFEERDLIVKYIKLGLTPYIIKAGNGNDIAIEMKKIGWKKERYFNHVPKIPGIIGCFVQGQTDILVLMKL